MALPQNRRGVYIGPGPAWDTLTSADPTDLEAASDRLTPVFSRRDRVIADQLGISSPGSPADVAAPVPWPDNSYTRMNRLVGDTAAPVTRADVEMARAIPSLGQLINRGRRALGVLLGG